MIDYAQARRTMVDTQVRPVDVTDLELVAAFDVVPREAFVPAPLRDLAYLDRSLDLPAEQPPRALIDAATLARLLQAAGVRAGEAVLHVGAATGYGAAVSARMGARVTALECDAGLVAAARPALEEAGAVGVAVVSGPLEQGWAAAGPYDVIVIEGAVEAVPAQLSGQLAEGGRLVAVVGGGRSGRAMLYVRVGQEASGRLVFDAALPPLPGFSRPRAFVF